MTILEDVRKFGPGEFVIGFSIILSMFCPGFLLLFMYRPELIASLDFLKLMVFALALTLPVVVLNVCLVAGAAPEGKAKENPQRHVLVIYLVSMALSAAIYYGALVVAYALTLRFKWFLVTVAVMQGLILLTAVASINNKRGRRVS